MTLIVGLSQLDNLSLRLLDSSSSLTFSRSTERMSLEELQDCSCVARGCLRRSVFVFFSYAFIAARKMVRKWGEDVDVEGDWDICNTLISARDSEGDREFVNVNVRSDCV